MIEDQTAYSGFRGLARKDPAGNGHIIAMMEVGGVSWLDMTDRRRESSGVDAELCGCLGDGETVMWRGWCRRTRETIRTDTR